MPSFKKATVFAVATAGVTAPEVANGIVLVKVPPAHCDGGMETASNGTASTDTGGGSDTSKSGSSDGSEAPAKSTSSCGRMTAQTLKLFGGFLKRPGIRLVYGTVGIVAGRATAEGMAKVSYIILMLLSRRENCRLSLRTTLNFQIVLVQP